MESVAGVHLTRTEENVGEIDALAEVLGGRVGLDPVLDDLNRRGRRSIGFFGRAVAEAFTWDAEDRATTDWFPQGITTSADASDTEEIAGRRILAASWYAKEVDGVNQGSRVSFWDIDERRYRHVLLVVPTLRHGRLGLAPLKVHAGGMVWVGPYLHIAATTRGFVTCRLDDLMRIPDDVGGGELHRLGVDGRSVASFGYRYVLPVRFSYQAFTDEGHTKLRYSFLSLDRGSVPPTVIAGEYGATGQTMRLARYPLDIGTALLETGEDGAAHPLDIDAGGVPQMQGASVVDGRWHVTVSHGGWGPGSIFVGQPGRLRRRRFATPMGPEDITFWPSTDSFWSLSEHPRRRWIYRIPRSRLR